MRFETLMQLPKDFGVLEELILLLITFIDSNQAAGRQHRCHC